MSLLPRRYGSSERDVPRWKLHLHPHDPEAAAYVRNDGEVKWNLNDLDVATVEEINPKGAMEVQNLRSLGMGWAWYVDDLSGGIDLEPAVLPPPEVPHPCIAEIPFPHAPPGPAENELLGGRAPDLLPCSQDVELVVSEINIPTAHLKKALRCWTRKDLNVRVFQNVRTGGPRARQVCHRETFDMDSGALLACALFNPVNGQSIRLLIPALPDCSPLPQTLAIRNVFWYSELEPVPESVRRVVARCQAHACAHR